MATKTAAVFSLALFPQLYLFQRVSQADAVIVLTDRHLDDRNHVNRCMIRTAVDSFRKIKIPVNQRNRPADQVDVAKKSTWVQDIENDVRRSYRGLLYRKTAMQLLQNTIQTPDSPWLTDYLMEGFLGVLQVMGWEKKIVLRGDTLQRRRYGTESEYILDMCGMLDCRNILMGRSQLINSHRALFRRVGVEIIMQRWNESKEFPSRDSILDALARHPVEKIKEAMV